MVIVWFLLGFGVPLLAFTSIGFGNLLFPFVVIAVDIAVGLYLEVALIFGVYLTARDYRSWRRLFLICLFVLCIIVIAVYVLFCPRYGHTSNVRESFNIHVLDRGTRNPIVNAGVHVTTRYGNFRATTSRTPGLYSVDVRTLVQLNYAIAYTKVTREPALITIVDDLGTQIEVRYNTQSNRYCFGFGSSAIYNRVTDAVVLIDSASPDVKH